MARQDAHEEENSASRAQVALQKTQSLQAKLALFTRNADGETIRLASKLWVIVLNDKQSEWNAAGIIYISPSRLVQAMMVVLLKTNHAEGKSVVWRSRIKKF